MKKILNLLLGLAMLIALFVFASPKDVIAQNSYGGLCCDYINSTCHHPIGDSFDNARWEKGLSLCPPIIIN